MNAGVRKLELNIPKDVMEHAVKEGLSIEGFRKTLELFGTMQLVAETSSLTKGKAEKLSKRVKESAWMRVARKLNL